MAIMDNYRIRTNSHIINLLGDELIGSDSLALFEIVKNSYDADASVVTISLDNLFREVDWQYIDWLTELCLKPNLEIIIVAPGLA